MSALVASRSSLGKRRLNRNKRTVLEAIDRFKHGIEVALRMLTGLWGLRVTFRGTSAFTDARGRINLPDVDFLARETLTDEDVEDILAYLIALRGYGFHEAAHLVEDDMSIWKDTAVNHGMFIKEALNFLGDIRIEVRFGERDVGIREALEYVRETWIWPRVARKLREKDVEGKEPLYVGEAFFALQLMAKHPDAYDEHELWLALPEASRTWALRTHALVDATRAAFDVPPPRGTHDIRDAILREAPRWKEEHDACAALWTGAGPVPPFLLATVVTDRRKYLKSLTKEEADKFLKSLRNPVHTGTSPERSWLAGRPILAVEAVDLRKADLGAPDAPGEASEGSTGPVPSAGPPSAPETSTPAAPESIVVSSTENKRPPPPPGCERTLVLRVPENDTEQETILILVLGTLGFGVMISEEAREQLEELLRERTSLDPAEGDDGEPYLVYTNENDMFVHTTEADASELTTMRREVEEHYGAMTSRLATLLRARTRTKWRGGQDHGDMIDPAAIADIAVAHYTPQVELRPFMYQVPESTLQNTVVGLIADASGSMLSAVRVPYHARGRAAQTRLDLARYAVMCFGDCLHRARLRFGVWAFSSNEANNFTLYDNASPTEKLLYARFGGLYIETCKTFDQDWLSVERCVPNLGMRNDSNYDADSVWWAGLQLIRQDAARRVLYVFSDGQPLAWEPNATVTIPRQQRHLRDVVQTLRHEAGVEVVGFGIDDTSVEHYYQPACTVVRSVNDLPAVVLNEMENLLLETKKRS